MKTIGYIFGFSKRNYINCKFSSNFENAHIRILYFLEYSIYLMFHTCKIQFATLLGYTHLKQIQIPPCSPPQSTEHSDAKGHGDCC